MSEYLLRTFERILASVPPHTDKRYIGDSHHLDKTMGSSLFTSLRGHRL